MAFEKGGVCGALAKTFANLNGMVGVPSFVVGQPGHAATLTYELRRDASGKMVPTYRVQNDVSGFGRSRNADVAHWMGVLDAERSLFDSEMQLAAARSERLSSIVNVCLALGGGWK